MRFNNGIRIDPPPIPKIPVPSPATMPMMPVEMMNIVESVVIPF